MRTAILIALLVTLFYGLLAALNAEPFHRILYLLLANFWAAVYLLLRKP